MADLDLTMPNTEKLVLTLEDKEKYVVHYKNHQFYLRQGMRLKKVHRVIEFDQEPWMVPYIRMYTEFRKQAKSDFETDFYKLSMQTEDVYRDMEHDFDLYDTSNYPKDHPLFSATNKKVLGKMKDECRGEPIDEVVAVRPKMYSVKKAGKKI